MLKNIIVIENGKQYLFNSEHELVRKLICDNYYELSEKERIEQLKIKAIANSLGKDVEIIEELKGAKEQDLSNKFIIINEKTFILSLLNFNNIILLENVNSEIYTKKIDKKHFSKNYIIVNKFAKQILKEIISNY